MAIRSNVAWAQMGKQAGKGTLAPTFDFRTRLAADDRVAPRAEFATFAETDGVRDVPDSEKMSGGAEGGFQFGVRDAFLHKVAEAALGAKVSSGATNFTHEVTPQDVLSYYSLQQNLGDVLWEQSKDLIVNEWTVTVEAGGFMTSTLNFQGLDHTRLTSAPAGPAIASGPIYNFNDATVSIGGAGAPVRSFNFTLSNSLQLIQLDDFVPYDVYVGAREVTVGFDILFENLDHYNSFHYGSPTGTAQSPSTFVTDLNFLFAKGVNNSVEFDFDAVNYEEFPVGPDTGGDPIFAAVRARTRRIATGPLKVVVKNQTAT